MALNVTELAENMLTAAKDVLEEKWEEASTFAEIEFNSLAEGLKAIEEKLLIGAITTQQAEILFKMKKNAAQSVLLTIEGIGIIAAEQAINEALNVVKDTVNGVLNFPLI